MDRLDKIFEYVKKINPEMTREKLIKELGKNRYSSIALVMVSQNIRQEN